MTSPPHVVVAGTRRAWSPEQKRAILAEADEPGTTASAVVRRQTKAFYGGNVGILKARNIR